MNRNEWRTEMRQEVAAHLWATNAPGNPAWDTDWARRTLQRHVSRDALDSWLSAVRGDPPVAPNEIDVWKLDRWVPRHLRKRFGVYFTPNELAERTADLVGEVASVCDPAAGDGALLMAVARQNPAAQLLAIELDPDLAVATAIRGVSQGYDIRVEATDGLADLGSMSVEAVIMNPPYLGEKNHADVFERLREQHTHLSHAFAPRTDLANLFLARGLQLVGAGRLVAITSEYWLQSDAAAPIRETIREGFDVRLLERFGAGAFDDAPGHHTLVTVIERGPQGEFSTVDDGRRTEHAPTALQSDRWNPFAAQVRRDGVPLGDVAYTSQGFVSGADRVTRRHLGIDDSLGEVGDPIFMFDTLPPGRLKERVEPVLRGSQIEPGEVIHSFEPTCWALYVDGELAPDDAAVEHLHRYRKVLERRREAKTGAMPWYRMHWPRNRSQMRRPKLVTPRRAPKPTFALDLTGSVVSSDCTFVTAPDDIADEVGFLMELMRQLNTESAESWLRRYGKVKGRLIEFYAGPLESLPVDVGSLFSTA